MRKMINFRITLLSCILGISCLTISIRAHAAMYSPIAVSLIPPVQLPPSTFGVSGVRLSLLWGHNRHVYGLDVGGLGNITTVQFGGTAISGLFNITHGVTDILGVQLAGLANYNTESTFVLGAQLTLGLNINTAGSSIYGIDVGLLGNYTPHTKVHGVQFGLYNNSRSIYGLQIGLLNRTANLHGIQIGLLNFNTKGMFEISPLLNIGF